MISVYIADDEVWITIGLKKLIQKSGLPFEVIGEAHNGVTTLEDIKTLKPDVLFTDIRMPGLSGLEVMSYISEHQFATKVVLISGYAEFEYARQAMLCGAFDYLLKPIQQETLNKTLSRLRNELEPAASETSEDTMENATITDLSTAGTSLFKKILAYIQEHDTEELSLTSLAEMYNISSSRLSTLIKKRTGTVFFRIYHGKTYAEGERTFKRRQPLHRGDCKRSRLPRLLLFYKSFQKNAGNISKQIPEVSLNFSC